VTIQIEGMAYVTSIPINEFMGYVANGSGAVRYLANEKKWVRLNENEC
jgi:hypothetical protein